MKLIIARMTSETNPELRPPVQLPNRETGGPLRKTIGPVTIVDTSYLQWLERGAEMYLNEIRASEVVLLIPRIRMATAEGRLENSPALRERRRSRL